MITVSDSASSVVTSEDRRRRRWIDPKFQKQYAVLLMSVVFLVGAVLIGTFWFHSEQVLKTLESAGLGSKYGLHQLVAKQMQHLLVSVSVVVVLFGGFVFFLANMLSHRIVGPIFSAKRSLEAMAEGDFNAARIKLRSDDEFQEVGDLINRVVDRMEKHSRKS